MAIARKNVVLKDKPGVYHCTNRCVRRAFLCGYDEPSDTNYEHRRGWVRSRIQELVGIFDMEVFAYAVMQNHLHIVIHCDPLGPCRWSDEEVARRWCRVFPQGRDDRGKPIPPTEEHLAKMLEDGNRIQQLRERLGDLSWFMRCLDENIARRANAEDECTGRFWEGRFNCQRLADEGAVLACMAYVDLNPVRAKIADRPELSDFTSICDRIAARQARIELEQVWEPEEEPTPEQQGLLAEANKRSRRDAWLCPIERVFANPEDETGEPLTLDRYLALVDWTGRSVRKEDKGVIPPELGSILERLDLDVDNWVENVERYGGLFHRVAGKYNRILEAARYAGQRWMHGLAASRHLYRDPGKAAKPS